MKMIRIKKSVINQAASAANVKPCEFVSKIRSISLGRKVCAHLVKETSDGHLVFCCQ